MRSQLNQIISLTNAAQRSIPTPIHLPHLTPGETIRWLEVAAHPSPRKLEAVAASSAAAAGAYACYRYWASHHGQAILVLDDFELMPLHDLHGDASALGTIQQALVDEWGPFGPPDMTAMQQMAKNAGNHVFVLTTRDGRRSLPAAVLQTAVADVHGDVDALLDRYPTFRAIASGGGWKGVDRTKGDTALLLQITAFGERNNGVGSMLRDAVLQSLPASIKYALTTTPVPEDFDPDMTITEMPPAARFHLRGGARPAGFKRGFKSAPPDAPNYGKGRQQNENILFMRYTRLANGEWDGVSPSNFRPRGREKSQAVASLAPV